MKKILILFAILFVLNLSAKTLIVEGNYKNFENKPFKKVWKVKCSEPYKENTLSFYLDGKLKAKVFIQNGKIVRIEEFKVFQGKRVRFTIEKPNLIKTELKGNFYPFAFVHSILYNKNLKSPENKTFKLLEVREK